MKAAEVIVGDTLLEAYRRDEGALAAIEGRGQRAFFLNAPLPVEPLPPTPLAAPSPLEERAGALQGAFALLLLIALLAGLLSFLSPCTLPLLPAYLAVTLHTDRSRQLITGASFIVGLTIVFAVIGMSATLVGSVLMAQLPLLTEIVGIVLIVLGGLVAMGWGLPSPLKFGSPPERPHAVQTAFGALFLGGSLALAWTPCVGPILAGMLLLASTVGTALKGGLLLAVYGVGLGLPLVLCSGALQRLPRDGLVWRVLRGRELRFSLAGRRICLHTTSLVSGVLFILIGLLIATGSLTILNRFIVSSTVARWVFRWEGVLLEALR